MRAVISAANKSMIGPSLSVVQTAPSFLREVAPALSSPPKQSEPSNNPGANHLKPTGTSQSVRPQSLTTRSIMLLLKRVDKALAVIGAMEDVFPIIAPARNV